jgi:hypothetical protein
MPNVPRAMRTERSPIRFATPYLEVETRSVSSMEHAIRRELAQASHTANRNKRNANRNGQKGGDHPRPSPGLPTHDHNTRDSRAGLQTRARGS